MAAEMQACLPSRGTPSDGGGVPGGKVLTRDSVVEDVQRQRLRVAAAAFLMKRHLFRYRGTVSAAFVLGGIDAVGEHLYEVSSFAVGLCKCACGLRVTWSAGLVRDCCNDAVVLKRNPFRVYQPTLKHKPAEC